MRERDAPVEGGLAFSLVRNATLLGRPELSLRNDTTTNHSQNSQLTGWCMKDRVKLTSTASDAVSFGLHMPQPEDTYHNATWIINHGRRASDMGKDDCEEALIVPRPNSMPAGG